MAAFRGGTGEYAFGMASNSNYVAGMKTRSKLHAALNDGLFEVILIKYPKTLMDLQAIISDLLTQNFSSKHFVMFRTSSATFTFENETPWTLDGEFGGLVSSVDIKIEKGAVEFSSGFKALRSELMKILTFILYLTNIGQNNIICL